MNSIFDAMTDALAESLCGPYHPDSLRQWIEAKLSNKCKFRLSQWVSEFKKYEGMNGVAKKTPVYAGYSNSTYRESSIIKEYHGV
jgi:hypothetical protein